MYRVGENLYASKSEVASLFAVADRTISNWIATEKMEPPPITKYGARSIFYFTPEAIAKIALDIGFPPNQILQNLAYSSTLIDSRFRNSLEEAIRELDLGLPLVEATHLAHRLGLDDKFRLFLSANLAKDIDTVPTSVQDRETRLSRKLMILSQAIIAMTQALRNGKSIDKLKVTTTLAVRDPETYPPYTFIIRERKCPNCNEIILHKADEEVPSLPSRAS